MSLCHVVDVTVDAYHVYHMLYFVFATKPYRIKCIAVIGNLFSVCFAWFLQLSKEFVKIADFLPEPKAHR